MTDYGAEADRDYGDENAYEQRLHVSSGLCERCHNDVALPDEDFCETCYSEVLALEAELLGDAA